MGASRLRWGILGTGNIARQFAAGLNGSERCQLVAVGSRSLASAQEFAKAFNATTALASYDELLARPEVEAVYVSLPNAMHFEWTIKALRAGKHVLCEKPLATNLAQAQRMFDEARRSGRVLMEAFMYRSHPQTWAIHEAVAGGRIGSLRMIRTSFLFSAAKVTGNIKFNNELAGGSLMDIGCYCLSFSRFFAGAEPTAMSAFGHVHTSGVDDYVVGAMAFLGGIVANFSCGMTMRADNTAELLGTDGYIEIPVPWKPPVTDAEFTVVDAEGQRDVVRVSANKHLYALEADEFAAAVRDGTPARVSESDSLGNQRCLDELRRKVGTSFPEEV